MTFPSIENATERADNDRTIALLKRVLSVRIEDEKLSYGVRRIRVSLAAHGTEFASDYIEIPDGER